MAPGGCGGMTLESREHNWLLRCPDSRTAPRELGRMMSEWTGRLPDNPMPGRGGMSSFTGHLWYLDAVLQWGDGAGRFSRLCQQRLLFRLGELQSGIAIGGTAAAAIKQDPPWSFGHDGSVVVVPGVYRVPHPFRVLRLPGKQVGGSCINSPLPDCRNEWLTIPCLYQIKGKTIKLILVGPVFSGRNGSQNGCDYFPFQRSLAL